MIKEQQFLQAVDTMTPLWRSDVKKEWFTNEDRTTLSKPYIFLSYLSDGVSYVVDDITRKKPFNQVFKYEYWNALDADSRVVRVRVDYYIGTWGYMYGTEDNDYKGRQKTKVTKDAELIAGEFEHSPPDNLFGEDKFIKFAGKEIY